MSDPISAPRGRAQAAALVSALLLGAVLVFSALTKILSPAAFVAAVLGYGVLPAAWALPLAAGVTGLELSLGVLLILGLGRRAAAWLTLPLLLFFIGLLLHALRLGLESCGCFGEAITIPPHVELIVDLVLVLLNVVVLRWGRDLDLGTPQFRAGLGWATLCLGAALFLAGGTPPATDAQLDVTLEELSLLQEADPPLAVEDELFVFLFSADCEHCLSYVGGVELMHRRLEGVRVVALTFSDPQALDELRRDFGPTFPIHVIDESSFGRLTDMYPAAIWVHGGKLERSWSGHVPGHRELAERGGYRIRPTDALPELEGGGASAGDEDASSGGLFGGTVRSRH